MFTRSRKSLVPILLRAAALLPLTLVVLVLLGGTALARGRVQWGKTTIDERDGRWLLELKVFLPAAPHVAHVPMKFEFQPYTYYERAMVDGDKIVERAVPLEHQQSLVETVDVGFMEPSTGNILNRTKFSFKVTRSHGFNAGEYQVTVRDIDGNRIGGTTKVTFEGENEIIDRRSMVFGGDPDKKKKKKQEEAEEEGDKDAEGEAEAGEKAEKETEATEENDDETEAAGPPAIEQKPGGCGCRTGRATPEGGGAAALLLLGALVGRRRLARTEAQKSAA